MQRDRNLIHHQIKRHPLRRLHTHKHRSEQQRTHPLRSGQLQPRHLDIRPPLRLGKPPPIHRRQTQNATNIALTNTPLPHEWILVIRKISRPVIQNPMTNRIIRRPSPHLTQTHRILSTARTLTPRQRRPRPPRMTTTRHPQMSNTSLHNTTPRIPPSLIFSPATLCTKPFHSCLSRCGLSLGLSPHNPPTQLPQREPGPLNPLLLPGHGTPRIRPRLISNPAILCMQPFQSFPSRRGLSLGLSPHNPPTQLPPRYPTPLNPLPRPGRTMPCSRPSSSLNSATLCMQPVQSCPSRRGSSLVLSPHNPPTQFPPRYPTPLNLLLPPVRSTPRSLPSSFPNSAILCMQPFQSFLSRCGFSLGLSLHNPPTQLLPRDPTPPSPLLLSCIRILLPGRDRTIPAGRGVGGRLGRRRPSLRLTRIHLPRRPLRGSTAHQPALPNTPNRRRNTLNTTHRRSGSTPQIRRALQTCLPHLRRQLFGTRLRGRTGLPLGQTIPRGPMQRDGNLIHHQIKRHPLRRLHTHKHRSEQQRTHPLRSGQLQPRHLDIRPPLRLGKPPPIHRRQTQNATNIALTNTPFPHEWILVILKISRPVIQNPTTNLIIRRPSPHLTQTHRILSTARTLTPRQRRPRPPRMTTTRHPQMSNTSLHNTTPRIPPSLIFNSATLYTKPFPSFLSRRGLSLVLSPHNPPTQLPSRDPGPLNLLLRPGRSTPRLPPSVISNSATLCMQPVHSFLSRRGSSLGLSPHNPPTQLPSRDPGPLNLLLRPGRSMPRLPPSVISNSATLCMQPVHSFLSRRGSSLGLSPHNPPTQLPPRDPGPLNLLPLPGRSTPRLPPSVTVNSAILCTQPLQSFASRRGLSLVLSPHNPPTQLPQREPTPLNPLPLPERSTPRLPPNIFVNSATLGMQPVPSFASRRGLSLVLSPHNPPTQLPQREPGPPSPLLRPVRSTPRSPPSRIASPAILCMQPVHSFLSRCGSSLVLSPHNPPTQLPQRDPTPPSLLLLSCIRILLPRRHRTIPARRRVGGRLGRRRPSLRLTRIHLPRRPLRGSTPHQPALPNTPHRRRHTPHTTHRRPGSTPHIRRPLQTRLPHPHGQLFSTRPHDRTGLQLGQTIP